MTEIQEITIEQLIARYSVLLLDAYGVLVCTSGALPGAAELIAELNATQKPYYIVTNDASKLPMTSAKLFQGYGLAITPDRIITSGSLLKSFFEEKQIYGASCVVLGPGDSIRYVESAGGRVVSSADEFDVLVIGDESGFPFQETIDDVLTGLIKKIDCREDVQLVLPNPDLIYPKGDQSFGITCGGIALMLEAALGLRYPNRNNLHFERLGKPHAAIFQEAQRRSGTRDMVMIGDQLETDIRGAINFGIDSVLVGTGVTNTSASDIHDDLRPTYGMRSIASGRHGSRPAS